MPRIKFSIAQRVKGNTFINNYNLCLSEKTFIIRNLDDIDMLNKRSELISKCRHINKQLLNRVKDNSNVMIDFNVCFFIAYKIFFIYIYVSI